VWKCVVYFILNAKHQYIFDSRGEVVEERRDAPVNTSEGERRSTKCSHCDLKHTHFPTIFSMSECAIAHSQQSTISFFSGEDHRTPNYRVSPRSQVVDGGTSCRHEVADLGNEVPDLRCG